MSKKTYTIPATDNIELDFTDSQIAITVERSTVTIGNREVPAFEVIMALKTLMTPEVPKFNPGDRVEFRNAYTKREFVVVDKDADASFRRKYGPTIIGPGDIIMISLDSGSCYSARPENIRLVKSAGR